MVKKTLKLLGIGGEEDTDFFEYPSSFPAKRSPVYLFAASSGPGGRIDHKTPQDQMELWVARMDNVMRARLDRKGIIHSISYERAKFIHQNSEHAAYMIVPNSGKETQEKLEEFRRAPPPAFFVSPAITTGYDFPFDACEFNIIAKVPFLDVRGPVLKARQEEDPEYAPYVTAQTITQAHGRSMRDMIDQSETFIMDGHIHWFIHKHRALFPFWFHRLVIRPSGLPEPPKALLAASGHKKAPISTLSPASVSVEAGDDVPF
jgi:Rad3-related DNA helicase